MKKLIIICEGQSEQMFCDRILKDHFLALNIEIEYPLIAHSNGGIVKWAHLKPQIELHYQANNEDFITTFIDYYGIEAHHGFPQWLNAHLLEDKSQRMELLEQSMETDLSIQIQQQFIGYIQLHEFEALVLSDHNVFSEYYDASEYNSNELLSICILPPESVNNGRASAPSKRLMYHIPAYDKVNDGVELLILVGLQNIRNKCPRFNAWITKLESI